VVGTNSRLDALQAAVLRVKLRHLEHWTRERSERALAYTRLLEGTPGLVLPREQAWGRSAWHLYTLRVERRDGLQAHLHSRGIATSVHYPRPIHLQPAMAAAGGKPGDLPVSERLSLEVLQVPLYPGAPARDARVDRTRDPELLQRGLARPGGAPAQGPVSSNTKTTRSPARPRSRNETPLPETWIASPATTRSEPGVRWSADRSNRHAPPERRPSPAPSTRVASKR
jgi:hypothetical protein